jgi:uncharacterized protein
LVVAEVTHLVGTRLDVRTEVLFLGDLASGDFAIEPVLATDWLRIAELVARYADLPLGSVDASVVVVAERLGISRVATTDRRDFSVVRPNHVERFDLVL